MSKNLVAMYSGGIDSNVTVFYPLEQGYDVYPVYICWRTGNVAVKECKIIMQLWHKYKDKYNGRFHKPSIIVNSNLIKDIKENIKYRNKIMLDFVARNIMSKYGTNLLSMGEYNQSKEVGWVNNWSVALDDCEPSALQEYLDQYNIKLIIMDDFGKASLKHDRVQLLKDVIGEDVFLTTSCGYGHNGIDCGECYLCGEIAVAKRKVFGYDKTIYLKDPEVHNIYYPEYCVQMNYLPGLLRVLKNNYKNIRIPRLELIKKLKEM